MKKINLAIFIMFATMLCGYSQQLKEKVGNNPTIIEPSAVLEVESTNKGVLFPRVALTSNQDNTTIESPQVSLIVYNTATAGVYPNEVVPGFYYWDGVIWKRFPTTATLPAASITTLNCQDATHIGTLILGIEATGVSYTISYTGGNFSPYAEQSIASTGVTGLTASLSEGTLASGSGTLTYNITGIPSTGGMASFAINLGGQICTLNCEVEIPLASLTSILCEDAIHNGTLTSGYVSSAVSSEISYTGGNSGSYTEQNIASTGVTGLTATLSAGTLASGAGTLTYTITGTPLASGMASFAINIGGQTCNLTREVAAIASLDCNGATHNGKLTYNIDASGVSSVISYTGGDGSIHTGQTVSSTGVTGLTATLEAGNFANGAGTVTYNITGTPSSGGNASFAIKIGGKNCSLTRSVNPIASLDCNSITNIGTLTKGIEASGASFVIAYTGGDGSAHTGQTVTSTGVTGLTATLVPGNFVAGDGTLTYIITGLPYTHGTASFAINIGGQSCELLIEVAAIASLDCDNATHYGILKELTEASGVSFVIPYSGSSGTAHSGQTVSSTGVTGLTATLVEGNFAAGTYIYATGTGTLTYIITGTPSSTGTASFAISIGGRTCTVTRELVAISLDCSSIVNNGSLSMDIPANNVNSVISYTEGNGTFYSGQVVNSTGVSGLTATLMGGNFEIGAGSLTYHISGIPSSLGIASFAINIGGQTCTLTRTISSIASLDCFGATNNGSITANTALGSSAYSVIAYTDGNGSQHNGQVVTSTGVTGLTAYTSAGNFASGNGTLTYDIRGTASSGGTAYFAIDIGGRTCTLEREVLIGNALSAMNCGAATINGTLTKNVAANGVSFNLPYSAFYTVGHSGLTVSSTGVIGLTATLAPGTILQGSGQSFTFNITGTPSSGGVASFALNIGGKSCTVDISISSIGSLNCAGITESGGKPLQGLTYLASTTTFLTFIPYTDGDGTAFAQLSFPSTGVTGLTATLVSGNYALGNGSLTFKISGRATSAGIATFNITISGRTCTFTRIVDPASFTMAQNIQYLITSCYDQDYLPYTATSVAATTNTQAADGSNEATVIDIQGSISSTQIKITVPIISVIGGVDLPYYSSTITIPAEMTEDGISRELTLERSLGSTITETTKSSSFNLVAEGGTLNLKKLDINSGIGNDGLGVVIGQFTYPYNSAGDTSTIKIRIVPLIPDKMYGLPDNNGNSTSHNMFYAPIVAEDGKVWLNNNLGANYANTNHLNYSPTKQATARTDSNAYGSKFQWGRKPDGHEFYTYSSGTFGTPVYGTTTTKSDNPAGVLFILNSTAPSDWRITSDGTLWGTVSSDNNPCPLGFRLPTVTDFNDLVTSAKITESSSSYASNLKFSAPGQRLNTTGSSNAIGTTGFYWTSTVTGSSAGSRNFLNTSTTNTASIPRSTGYSVRCIKD